MLKSEKLKAQLVAKNDEFETLSDPERAMALGDLMKLAQDYSNALASEAEQRASLEAVDPETLERRSLLKRAKVSDFVKAVIEHRPVTGASAEARAAFGCLSEHEIPLELFEPTDKQKAVTPAPAAGSRPLNVRPAQPYVYSRSTAGYLGVDMPTVEAGVPGYPVLTTGTPSGMVAKDGKATDTAAAITVLKSDAKRLTGAYVVRHEDMAVFPELEPALRRDIPMSLANTLDQQLLAGSGTSPELKSLLSQLTDPTANTTTEKFGTFISTITGLIDGVHAYELMDLKALVGMKTYEKMTETFAANTATSAADYLHDKIGGLRATKRIAKPASDDQQAIVRLGMEPMCAVMPVWGGVQLIDDPYTGAKNGQRTITAVQLVGDVLLLRSDAFKQVDFHLN